MLMMVVALFTLAWLPLQLYDVLNQIFPEINEYTSCHRETEFEKDRKTERQKDRKTEKQKDRKTEKLMHLCSYPYINIIWFCMHWLAMSNSCYNPFIYLLLNVSISIMRTIQRKLYKYHHHEKSISYSM